MKRYIIISIIAAAMLIGGALFMKGSAQQPVEKSFTTSELRTFDGKNGRECYVAVEGKVYKIEQGRLWKEGEHTTSQNQVHCGQDLTAAISKSPHGTSKLSILPVMGKLVK